jgi:hypothetical protein
MTYLRYIAVREKSNHGQITKFIYLLWTEYCWEKTKLWVCPVLISNKNDWDPQHAAYLTLKIWIFINSFSSPNKPQQSPL